MFCWHQWGAVHDRLQTCIKCGKVRVAECPHTWKTIKILEEIQWGNKVSEVYILQCTGCGEIKQERVGV